MEPSWEADNFSCGKEISRLLWNPKVHHPVHKSPSLTPNLNRMNPVHNFPHSSFQIHSNIIFPSMPNFATGLFPSGFPANILYTFLISPIRAVCPTHLILLDLPTFNNIWWIVQVMELLVMQSSPVPPHFLPLRSRYSPQHPLLVHP